MKKLVLALTILLTVGTVSAYNINSASSNQLDNYESMINERTSSMPPFFSSLIGNQTINVVINNDESNTSVGAKLKGLTLTEIQNSAFENATIEIITNQKTFNNISESDKPVDAAIREYNQGDITYRAQGFWNKLKLAIIEPFLTG